MRGEPPALPGHDRLVPGHDLFVSYARADDEPFVLDLVRRLGERGLRVWWDRAAMESRGRTFLQEIRDAIAGCERLILVVGPAVAGSDYVRAEWQWALEICRVVVPVLRGGEPSDVPRELTRDDYLLVPGELARFHAPDFRVGRDPDAAFAELTRILETPIPALGALSGVAALPANFLPRPRELEALAGTVLEDTRAPTVITSAKQTVGLQGMGGIGKSVLAAAFARSCAARRAFGDGVVWLHVGRQPALPALGAALARAMKTPAADAAAAAIETSGRLDDLAPVLQDRSCLVVLDDVWHVAHVAPFRGALGPRCRLLVTSRDVGLVASAGARAHRLDVLADAQALAMLARWSEQEPATLPAAAHDVMRECGGLPLALAMAGAMARGRPEKWPDILARLHRADLDRIRAEFPDYPYPDLLRAIDVGVEALDADHPGRDLRARYLELAVFPPGRPIPPAPLRMLWGAVGLDALDVDDVVDALVTRSLGRRDEAGRLVLHDLQADFVRGRAPSLRETHERLLAAYAAACPGDWSRGPDDGYFLDHLVYHLARADRHGELAALVTSYDWIARRLASGPLTALFRDHDEAGDARAPARVRDALRRSAQALGSYPAELPGQLLARIDPAGEPTLAPLLAEARARARVPWLRPRRATLAGASSPLAMTLSGHEGTVHRLAVTPGGRWAISVGPSSPDRTIRVWDLDAGGEVACFAGQAQGHAAVALTADGRLALCAAGADVNLWDVARAERAHVLTGHRGAVTAIAVAPERPRAVSACDGGDAIVWDLAARQALGPPLAHGTPVRAVALSPDGRLAVTASDETVTLWDLDAARALTSAPLDSAFPDRWRRAPLAVSADGRRVHFGNPLYAWEPGAASPPALLGDVHDLGRALAVSADGSTVLATRDDHAVTVLDRATRATRTIPAQPMALAAVALTPDGRRAVVSYYDHQILVWDLDRLPAAGAALRGVAAAVRIADDGERVTVSYRDGDQVTWRLVDDDLVEMPAAPGAKASPGPRPATRSVADEVQRRIDRANTGARLLGGRGPVRGRVKFIGDQRADRVLVVERTTAKTSEAAEPPDVPAADRGYGVELVERGAGALRTRRLGGHASPVTSARLTPDGTRAVTASIGRLIRVWDLASGEERRPLVGHRGIIRQVLVTPDSRHVVSASDDRTVRAWDLATGAEVARFTADAAIVACDLAPDGRTLVAADGSGTVHVLAFER